MAPASCLFSSIHQTGSGHPHLHAKPRKLPNQGKLRFLLLGKSNRLLWVPLFSIFLTTPHASVVAFKTASSEGFSKVATLEGQRKMWARCGLSRAATLEGYLTMSGVFPLRRMAGQALGGCDSSIRSELSSVWPSVLSFIIIVIKERCSYEKLARVVCEVA